MKRNPLVFRGTVDATMTEEWISMIEKIFEFDHIEDEEKVKCVVYMSRKDARIWWDTVKRIQDTVTMT